jgi:rare lipoprotein A
MRDNQQFVWPLIVAASVLLSGCAAVTKGRADLDLGIKERGIASWYGDDFQGWTTASGELYDMHALTAAHRTLPLGTVARITNVVNGGHVMIRITDRGPYVNGRILDLSYAAAKALGMVQDGVSAIQLQVVGENLFEAGMTEPPMRIEGGRGHSCSMERSVLRTVQRST